VPKATAMSKVALTDAQLDMAVVTLRVKLHSVPEPVLG